MTRLSRRTTVKAIKKAARESYYRGYVERLDPKSDKWPSHPALVPERPDEGWPMYCFIIGE